MTDTPTREDAWTLLTEFTDNPSLLKHALAVEAAMTIQGMRESLILPTLNLEVVRFVAHCLEATAHAGHVTVVVRTQDIDQVIVTTLALVEVIGDV